MAWSPVLPTAPPLLAVPGWFAVLILSGAGAIPSAEALGSPTLTVSAAVVRPTGIPSGEVVSVPVVKGRNTLAINAGIPSAEAVGTATVSRGAVNLAPTGIASGEAFGTATVTSTYIPPQSIFPSGIAAPGGGGPLVLTDDFNRADNSSSLGSGWTNRAGVIGISGNAAYSPTNGNWVVASNNTPLTTDDMEASITFGSYSSGLDYNMVAIGASSSGEMVIADHAQFDGKFHIYSCTDWAFGGLVDQAAASGSKTTGDVLTLKRVGNVYTVYLNGVSTGCTWTDSANAIPRDSSHRFTAIGIYDDGSGQRRIDSFTATDAAAGAGSPIGTPTVTVGAPPTQNIFVSGIASGEAFGTATVVPPTAPFTPFTETNTARTGQPVPAGCTGCYLTLIGAGGGGGGGRKGGSSSIAGGSGGGGGGYVPRTFIPVASLGSTYSVAVQTGSSAGGAAQTTAATNGNPGTAGAATTFVSGATSISVGGGGAGGGGTQTTVAGGTGGAVTGATGDAGTAGGTSGITTGTITAGVNNGASASGGAGGGGGGGQNNVGSGMFGMKGGDTNGQAGGAAGATNANGGSGSALVAGVAGSGGGGSWSGVGGTSGGNAPGYGGGGGGGNGYQSSGVPNPGGTGGPGYSKVEWV